MLQRKKERKKERKKGRKKGRKMSGNNSNAARSAGYGGSFFFARARYRHLHRNGFESPAPQNHFFKNKNQIRKQIFKEKKKLTKQTGEMTNKQKKTEKAPKQNRTVSWNVRSN